MNVAARFISGCLIVLGPPLYLHGSIAAAATLRVGPVRVLLDSGTPVATLTVHNSGLTPAVIQLEPMQWRQEDGADVYETTGDLIATPPIFSLAPGESQTVRSGLRGKLPADTEQAYRLYVREVVPETPSGPDGANAGTLQIALRIGVPVFVRPESALRPAELKWTLLCRQEACEIAAHNTGQKFARVHRVRIVDPATGHPVLETSVPGYVLAGSQIRWQVRTVQPPSVASPLRLEAQTEEGHLTAIVTRAD